MIGKTPEAYSDSTTSEEAKSYDLISLVSTGSVPSVRRLLETVECDVNYVNEHGDTALMVAAGRNDTEIMQLLINHGANVSEDREYLMKYAEKYHNKDMMDLINSHTLKPK